MVWKSAARICELRTISSCNWKPTTGNCKHFYFLVLISLLFFPRISTNFICFSIKSIADRPNQRIKCVLHILFFIGGRALYAVIGLWPRQVLNFEFWIVIPWRICILSSWDWINRWEIWATAWGISINVIIMKMIMKAVYMILNRYNYIYNSCKESYNIIKVK